MALSAAKRVKREFKEVFRSEEMIIGQINIELVNDVWTDLLGEILGPAGTPYAGGRFKLEIKVPETYPFSPPKIKFKTYIWHPNVSTSTGQICLDMLKEQWGAALTLHSVLVSIRSLLESPQPDETQNPIVTKQFMKHKNMFFKTAQHWTNVYAEGPKAIEECDVKVARFVEMGLDSHKVRVSLSASNWDLLMAAEGLFGADVE